MTKTVYLDVTTSTSFATASEITSYTAMAQTITLDVTTSTKFTTGSETTTIQGPTSTILQDATTSTDTETATSTYTQLEAATTASASDGATYDTYAQYDSVNYDLETRYFCTVGKAAECSSPFQNL